MSGAKHAELVDNVRHWVHFDNLAETLSKQVNNARTMRKTFEDKILTLLDTLGIRNAQLQITGAVLQRDVDTKPYDLSWTLLEEQLHNYYRTKGKQDETASVLEFIRKNRGTKTTESLKKTLTAETPLKKPPST